MTSKDRIRDILREIQELTAEPATPGIREQWNRDDSGILFLGSDSRLARVCTLLSDLAVDRRDERAFWAGNNPKQGLVPGLWVGLSRLRDAIGEWCRDYEQSDSRLTTLFRGENVSSAEVEAARRNAFDSLQLIDFVLSELPARIGSAAKVESPCNSEGTASDRLWTDLCERLASRTEEERWQVFDSLCVHLPAAELSPQKTSTLPLLLLKRSLCEETGMVGELTVRRRRGGSGMYPELGVMGLTAMSEGGDSGFKQSLDHVWRESAFAAQNQRYSWRIARYAQEREALALQRFHNRSCEAAFLCTLWHAAGGIPGGTALDEAPLDRHATVTALIGKAPAGDPRGIPLDRVAGLEAKAVAAASAGIKLIVVAAKAHTQSSQSEWASEIARARKAADNVEILTANTIGEAFEELISIGHIRRLYHAACAEAWHKKFTRVDAQGRPVSSQSSKT